VGTAVARRERIPDDEFDRPAGVELEPPRSCVEIVASKASPRFTITNRDPAAIGSPLVNSVRLT